MHSPITNVYRPNQARLRPPVERVLPYRPKSEWTYSHHASITSFEGHLYAIWSNGREHEDYPGQRVLVASSTDFYTWSEPTPLVDALPGEHSELVLTAAGFYQHGATLVAYYGQYEYTQESLREGVRLGRNHQGTSLWALISKDGHTWSESLPLGVPIVPNHGPQRTSSGRLIISGNISFPYTDDPAGLSGWTMTGIYPSDMAPEVYDDSEGFWTVQSRRGWPAGLCEGSFYQTDDGVLHMLLRATGPGHAGKLWLTESHDDGTTWTDPGEVDFTDNNTKFHFGRLPDGRFYYVGSPDPEPRGARCPLVLSLSEDGVRFDRHYVLADEDYEQQRPGHAKGGLYGYPHTLVHEGYLYVIVSLRKEAVAVFRVPLSEL